MASFLFSLRFNDQEEVEASLKELFASKDNNWYWCGSKDVPEMWLHTVHDGLYFEFQDLFLVTWREK